jgi:hypothetical protein
MIASAREITMAADATRELSAFRAKREERETNPLSLATTANSQFARERIPHPILSVRLQMDFQ